MAIVGIVISILALTLSLFTYFKHDRKIKQQSALINKYQLEKIDKEKEEQKRAIIEANLLIGTSGTRILKVYNKGKSIAKMVNVKIPEVEGFKAVTNPFPIDIRPQNGIDIILFLTLEAPNKIDIEFEWQDNFKDVNTDIQTIQLY